MSTDTLYTCPSCQRSGFTARGLGAHECQALGRRLTPRERLAIAGHAPASDLPPTSSPMTQTTHALALISSADLKVSADNLALLQQSVTDQFRRLRALRGEEALRGLLLGLTLHRVKASLPHGEFGGWAKQHATFGDRWVNYLMKLSLIFIDKAKATKPELLALPGDQTELSLDGMEGAQRTFMTKALKFVGEESLSDLLIKHGIKGVGLRTELAAKAAAEHPADAATAAVMASERAWKESWDAVQRVRSALSEPDQLHLLTDVKQIEILKAEGLEISRLADSRLAALRASSAAATAAAKA